MSSKKERSDAHVRRPTVGGKKWSESAPDDTNNLSPAVPVESAEEKTKIRTRLAKRATVNEPPSKGYRKEKNQKDTRLLSGGHFL